VLCASHVLQTLLVQLTILLYCHISQGFSDMVHSESCNSMLSNFLKIDSGITVTSAPVSILKLTSWDICTVCGCLGTIGGSWGCVLFLTCNFFLFTTPSTFGDWSRPLITDCWCFTLTGGCYCLLQGKLWVELKFHGYLHVTQVHYGLELFHLELFHLEVIFKNSFQQVCVRLSWTDQLSRHLVGGSYWISHARILHFSPMQHLVFTGSYLFLLSPFRSIELNIHQRHRPSNK